MLHDDADCGNTLFPELLAFQLASRLFQRTVQPDSKVDRSIQTAFPCYVWPRSRATRNMDIHDSAVGVGATIWSRAIPGGRRLW